MNVEKRDGVIVDFDIQKIEIAIQKCFNAVSSVPTLSAKEIADLVYTQIDFDQQINVEDIQDIVERVLLWTGHIEHARAYIRYRDDKTKKRKQVVPAKHKIKFEESKKYFPSPVQEFMFFNTYARFDWTRKRRETWVETVDRVVSYLKELSENKLDDYELIREYILNMKSMPSMRLIAMAGDAARRNNAAIYNCSYVPIDSIDSFVEALVISMSGCGVGYSVESKYVDQLPEVSYAMSASKSLHVETHVETFVIQDSTEGWAEALGYGLNRWFEGRDVKFDYSLIRPAGAILRVKGGRASGPEPLREMLDFIRRKIQSRAGSKLSTLDAHDITCVIGNAAVMGGTRRTAMIALFDLNDAEMLHCKDGEFWKDYPYRSNANNSVVLNRKLSAVEINELVLAMIRGKSGEPGIFSRFANKQTAPERRKRDEFGSNPCGEIVLRPRQFCNLSVAVQRADDTEETLLEKVRVATIIGTIQSMATNFPGLRDDWKKNCEEERLLGVDVTGQMDSEVFRNTDFMRKARDLAIQTNVEYAKKLGINPSAAVTCVKPSGNSGQFLNASSGVHSRWNDYYIRNIRVSSKAKIFEVLKSANVPMSPLHGYSAENAPTWVIHFPVKAPENSVTRFDLSLSDQLQYWKQVKLNWTEHNPSVTIYFDEEDVFQLGQWIYDNQEILGGMAFAPKNNNHYPQMPYEDITKEEYDKFASEFPKIDFSLIYFEREDYTTSSQEVACLAGACEF